MGWWKKTTPSSTMPGVPSMGGGTKHWWDRNDDATFGGRGVSWDASSWWTKKEDKREIVTPEMSSWSKSDFNRFHDSSFSRDVRKLSETYSLDEEKLRESYEAFPKYFKYNINNMYKHKPDIREIKNSGGVNQWQMEMIKKLDDYYMKGVTYDSQVNAGIMSSEIIKQLVVLATQRGQDPEEMMQQMGGGGAGDPNKGEGDSQGDGTPNKGMDQPDQDTLDKLLQEAIKKAEAAIEEIDDLSGMGLAEGAGGGGKGAGKEDSELTLAQAQELLALKQLLGAIDLPKKGIADFVKEVIKKGKSYFSSRYKRLEEEFFESDSDELLNIEELLPVFRRINLEDIVSEEREYHMKFDFYIDISGSMSSHIKVGDKSVEALTLAKLTAVKMISMGLIENYYVFNNQVRQIKSKAALLKLGDSGGTDINNVIKTIEKKGSPAIIITDAQDHIRCHTDMAYFLTLAHGIVGYRYYGNSDAGDSYADKFYRQKQVSSFERGEFYVPRDAKDHEKFINKM